MVRRWRTILWTWKQWISEILFFKFTYFEPCFPVSETSKPAPPSSCQEHLSHMKWLAHKETLRLSCCWFWSSLEHCRTCIFHMMRKVHGKNTPDLRISSWLCHWPIIAPWYIPNADDCSRNLIRTDNRCTSCIRGRQAQQVLDELVTHHIS